MSTATCPDPAKWSGVIEGTLPADELQQLTDHLGTCEQCQQTLQTQATGTIPVERLVAVPLESPPNDSAYWQAISRVERDLAAAARETDPGVDGHTPVDAPPATSELSFLDPPDDPAYIGKLHHFQVSRVVGHGGMGIVLEAFDTHLQRRVAIKILNPHLQENDVARQRFCREGRAAAAISHEHVVAMHHVARAQEDKVAYLVMQFIEGDTLENRLESGNPLPVEEVARVGMQIAAGLSAAHAREMVHRDIKPANILIEAETERVKLTDFGLARATDDVKLTKTGLVTGTPLYMSPEQAMGANADERSDLFSLGAVMYEMATGLSPFQAPTAVGVMKRIMDETPKPPHRLNPLITRPLSDLILTLLEKKPEQRPESAAAVARALASIVNEFGPLSPLQVPAFAASEVKKLSGSHRATQRRWLTVAWLAVAVSVLGLLTVSIARWKPGTTEETGIVASADIPSVVLSGNPGSVWSIDFSADGGEVVAGIEDGTVRLWDIESQQVIKSFNAHRGVVWTVRYHPARKIVATSGDDGRIKLWDAKSFELLHEWRAQNAVRGLAFSPEGDRIVAGDREGDIHVYEIDTGIEVMTRKQPGAIFGIDYSPDGKLLATVGSDKVVRLWDAHTLEERQTMVGHEGPIYAVRFAANSPRLATAGWNNNIRIWNVETGISELDLSGDDGDVWGVAFCGEGTHMLTAGQDGAARVWDLTAGEVSVALKGHSAAVHHVALDTERQRIATSSRDGTIRVWDLSSLAEKQAEAGHAAPGSQPSGTKPSP